MQFLTIKKRVAVNIGYVDSSGDILIGKDITETDIGNWVNDRYLDDLIPKLTEDYPEDFEVVSIGSLYKDTGTVAAGSTGTTLVATTAIFNSGMVGDTVYNSTDEETAEITAYTNTTTVTLDTTIGDTWDGDTIYILGHEFALGGDATDVRYIREVGVKYDSNDDYYRVAQYRDQNDLFKDGSEIYSEANPFWYLTTTMVDSVPTTTIGILPEASEPLANSLKLRYVQLPASLSGDTDVPRLPLGSHSILVYGATADAYRRLNMTDKANDFEELYRAGADQMITSYALTRGSEPRRIRPSRRLSNMSKRII